MFNISKFTRTLAPLLTGLLLAGCMDDLDADLDADLVAELIADSSIDDAQLELLLADPNLDLDDDDPLWADEDPEQGAIDEIDAPPLGPCDPPLPPMDVEAPELDGDPNDDGDVVKPPPLWVEAPELDPDPNDCDEDEDDCEPGEGLTPAPFGLDAPELDPDPTEPAPSELDNPDEVDVDNGYELW